MSADDARAHESVAGGESPDSVLSTTRSVEGEGHPGRLIRILTLNRPDRLNAVSVAMYERLLAELRVADEDRNVRAVVITGAGRAFCVGADLQAHGSGAPSGADRERYASIAQAANRTMQSMGTPVIAAVNGHAIGAGMELALSADFAIVAEEAKLRFPEVALGTFVGGGAVYTLAERVGTLRARELIYLGEFFSGREAAEMGVVNRAVPAERVESVALEWAERLAAVAPRSLAQAKRLIGPSGGQSREEAMALEQQILAEVFGTKDWEEGVRAFQEKRAPRYTGD